MLNQKRIQEAEHNFPRYVQEEWIFIKRADITQHVHFFLKNAETSLLTANTLLELSMQKEKRRAIGLKEDFESFLWVVVSSYYAMFYAALCLLAMHQIKIGEKSVHKVVADTLIAQFLKNKRLAKLIDSYEETQSDALKIIGADEKAFQLIESFEHEREKRHCLQYELGAEAKQNLAMTSLKRAQTFIAEIRNLLRK